MASQKEDAAQLPGLIRIPDPDIEIFRIISLPHFKDMLETRELHLAPPDTWDDPFENLLAMTGITDTRSAPWRQSFFDRLRWPAFGQCWSMTLESDSLWRAYSWYDADPVTNHNLHTRKEGVQVRTTPRKLLTALRNWSPTDPDESCFLGAVSYLPNVQQYIADRVGRDLLDAFGRGVGHAESLLFKRRAFEHEDEVRLLWVDPLRDGARKAVRVPITPNELFDRVTFEPRLESVELQEREDLARAFGIDAEKVIRSQLYQRVLLEVVIR